MFSKNSIILRRGGDLDVLTRQKALKNVLLGLKKKNYIKISERFHHIDIRRVSKRLEVIDLQTGGLNQNKLIFLDEKYFFDKNVSNKMILSLGLLLHLIVNKGEITRKRKKEFYSGFSRLSKEDKKEFFNICEREYGTKICNKVKMIVKGKAVNIKILKWQIIFKKSNLLQILELPFILTSNQIYKFNQKRKIYTIAFLGVDGSGKTTSIKNICKYLKKNDIKYEVGNLGVYHKRSFLINTVSRFMKKERNENVAIHKLNTNYTRKSPFKNLFRIMDIYFRHKSALKKAQKRGAKIIIFDRYFYDLILQSKIDLISKVLLKLIPKPGKLFFLYSDPKKIFARKKERTPKVLKEQSDKFKREISGICKIEEIETKTEERALKEILIILNNKEFLRCI